MSASLQRSLQSAGAYKASLRGADRIPYPIRVKSQGADEAVGALIFCGALLIKIVKQMVAAPFAAGKLMKLRSESGKMISEKTAFRSVLNVARNHIFQVRNPGNGYKFRLKNDRSLIFSVDLNRNETKKYERFRRDGRVPNSVRLGHLLFIKKAK